MFHSSNFNTVEERPEIQVSVVIPVYNSQDCLSELVRRLTATLENLGKRYEVILVNDCSTDNSWERIVEQTKTHDRLKGINLRRNFGQDNAIMAGLNYSSGDTVVLMDDDLQDNPDNIPMLLAEVEKGYDVCYASFDIRKEPWFKVFGSRLNDKIANIILRKPKEVYLSPYKAITRGVVNEIIKYHGPYPYIDGLIFRVTRNIAQVTIEHQKRFAGAGNYTLVKSIRVCSRLATNFSIMPLRLAIFAGLVSSFVGFILAIYFIIQQLVVGDAPSGWVSTIVAILFLGGVQLVSIGVVGEYVGRLFLHESKEPQFIVNEIIGKTGNEN